MPPKFNDENPRKVMVICAKGTLEDVYAALILVNGAVMEGMEAAIFFTFWGLDAITKKKMNKIKAPVIGNPSLPFPTILGNIPGFSWLMTKMMMKKMDDLNIPPVQEFLEMVTAGGGKVFACRAAIDMFGLETKDLWKEVEDIITVGEFYEKAEGAQVIFT
jgi:peroxiredoxin family protein